MVDQQDDTRDVEAVLADIRGKLDSIKPKEVTLFDGIVITKRGFFRRIKDSLRAARAEFNRPYPTLKDSLVPVTPKPSATGLQSRS